MRTKTEYGLSPAVAKKWHGLAVRRRDHLAELYHSGRWRRYFNEENFISLMRDAVQSVDRWSELARLKPPATPSRTGRRVSDAVGTPSVGAEVRLAGSAQSFDEALAKLEDTTGILDDAPPRADTAQSVHAA